MLFSSQDQEQLVPFWNQYITPALGPKATRQFVRATLHPSNRLADAIVRPKPFRPDALGGTYYPVDLTGTRWAAITASPRSSPMTPIRS